MTPKPVTPIGRVTYAEGEIVATLYPDRWRVEVLGEESPDLARLLALQYRDHYRGPQDGYYGQLILRDLAKETQGTLEMIERHDTPAPGHIAF